MLPCKYSNFFAVCAKTVPYGRRAAGPQPRTRRLPKRGFHNIFGTTYAPVNVSALEKFEDGAEVTAESLREAGIVKNALDGVKILGCGNLTKKLTVKAAAFSASAKEKIEAAGGKAEVI